MRILRIGDCPLMAEMVHLYMVRSQQERVFLTTMLDHTTKNHKNEVKHIHTELPRACTPNIVLFGSKSHEHAHVCKIAQILRSLRRKISERINPVFVGQLNGWTPNDVQRHLQWFHKPLRLRLCTYNPLDTSFDTVMAYPTYDYMKDLTEEERKALSRTQPALFRYEFDLQVFLHAQAVFQAFPTLLNALAKALAGATLPDGEHPASWYESIQNLMPDDAFKAQPSHQISKHFQAFFPQQPIFEELRTIFARTRGQFQVDADRVHQKFSLGKQK